MEVFDIVRVYSEWYSTVKIHPFATQATILQKFVFLKSTESLFINKIIRKKSVSEI